MTHRIAYGIGILAAAPPAFACGTCRPAVAAEIYNGAFLSTLLMLSLPLAIFLFIAAAARLFFDSGVPGRASERTEKWATRPIAAP